MRMPLLGLTLLLASQAASAQTRSENRANCLSSVPDIAILACTADINSGEESPEILSRTYYNRANLYSHTGHYDQAIADFTQSIALNPNNGAAYNNRGNVYANKGLTDQAIADFTKSIALKPNPFAYEARGTIFLDKGLYDSAIADFTASLAMSANYSDDNGAIGEFAQNRLLRAVKAASFSGRAWALHMTGHGAEGLLDANMAVQLADLQPTPSSVKARFIEIRAAIYEKLGQRDKAVADYRAALEIEPGRRGALSGLGRLNAAQQ
jgi:tetratricopeptide (TPR) repeat protein